MVYSNKLAELVNELKDSVDELKGLTSGLNKSIENKDNDRENDKGESLASQKIELLEKKIKDLEGKLFLFFGDSISKDVDQAECHALAKNNLIMRTIFEFLDLASLKNCRQVCKLWQEISGSVFGGKVKIKFGSYGKTVEKFSADFPLSSVSCNNFVFKENIKLSLKLFTNFFSLNSEMMTSLELSNIILRDEDGKINSLRIDSIIGARLRKLKFDCEYVYIDRTQLIFSLSKLKSIDYLNLKSCVLIVNEEAPKVQPIEIDLKSISFSTENGENIPNVRLSNFIDFHRCRKISVDAYHNFNNYDEATSISFPPDISFDSVVLAGVGYSWDVNSKPKIKRMCLSRGASLNINVLSDEIENLSFSFMAETENEQKILLPNLKQLKCATGVENLFNRLSLFSDCPNLVSISLENLLSSRGSFDCTLNSLPLSVKKLKLDGVNLIGDRFPSRLKSLHLANYSLQSIESILTKLTTDNLYVTLRDADRNRRLSTVPTDILLRILRLPFKKFAIDQIKWANKDNFQSSEFALLVNKRSQCYLFENTKAKDMSDTQIRQLMKF